MPSKLVRDKIPEIIESEGRKASYTIAVGSAKKWLLLAKCKEELAELQKAMLHGDSRDVLNAFVDVLTVLLFLQDELYLDGEDVEKRYNEKLEERGGFERGVILEVGNDR